MSPSTPPARAARPPAAYVARLHAAWLDDAPGERWRAADGTLVFLDISGFTPLTERLMAQGKIGAEELTDILRDVFGELLDGAERFGGDTLKFGGDALLIHFDGARHEERAAAAAMQMQQAMRRRRRLRTRTGTAELAASCGIASGPVHAFLVGSRFRELVLAGPTTTAALTAEAAAEPGEVLLDPVAARRLTGIVELGHARPGGARPLLGAPDVPQVTLVESRAEAPLGAVPTELVPYLWTDPDGDHRQAAVAFLQFRGIDDLLSSQGPGAVAAALDDLLGRVQEACVRHGVTFVGTDVDAGAGKIMLAAGAPAARELDEDGLLHALRESVQPASVLDLRAGANWGRVFAVPLGGERRRTWTSMGETTNLAARVMGKAPSGSVLATGALLDRTTAPFVTEALPPFAVKGVRQPVRGALVGDVRAAAPMPASDAAAARPTRPLVGREDLLEQLMQATAGERTAVVQLTGEAGIGKSRLVDEIVTRALAEGRQVVVVEGRPYEADAAYGAVRMPVRGLLAGGGRGDDEVIRAALSRRLAPEARRWLPLVAIPAGLELEPTAEQRALSPAAARLRLRLELLPVLAQVVDDGALLVVEDGQWLDEASIDLLDGVVRGGTGRRLATVVAARTRIAGLAEDAHLHLEVRPLERPAVDALIAHEEVGVEPLPPAVAALLAERSHGHPLFLLELLAAARSGSDPAELPGSVEALLAARIDRLDPADRELLREASVLGLAFEARELADLARRPLAQVTAVLERLSGVVDPRADGRWEFRQALMRDTAYEALPYKARRALHGRAASLLEAGADDHLAAASPLLSLHAHAAADHERSWRFSRIAADRAEAQGAPVEAAVFLRRALLAARHLPDVTETATGEIAQRLGDMYELGGLYDRADEAYRGARRHLAHDPVRSAQLALRRGWLRERTDSYAQALRWYTRGLAALGDARGVSATRIRGRLRLATGAAKLRQGRLRESVAPLESAAALARATDDTPSLAHACYLLDWAHTDLGEPVERYREQALALYESIGDWTGQANVLNNLGVNAYFDGRWQDALTLYERSRRARERGGDIVRYGEALHNVGELLVDQGRIAEAEPRLRQALGLWRGARFPVGVGVALMNLGRAAARSGDDAEAARLLGEAAATLDGIGSEQRVDVAIREAERHALAGRPGDALEVLEAARSEAGRRGSPALLAQIDRLRGGAVAALGDVETGIRLVRDARRAAAGIPFEEALATDLLARLAPLADEDVGADDVRRAREMLRDLGVVRLWPPPVPGLEHDRSGVLLCPDAHLSTRPEGGH